MAVAWRRCRRSTQPQLRLPPPPCHARPSTRELIRPPTRGPSRLVPVTNAAEARHAKPDWSAVRLHVVTGKGGTGKTTVAGALALALAAGGERPGDRRVLLVEVEG